MELRRSLALLILNALFVMEAVQSNRRPAMRPPPWLNPQVNHHGRGGMPIPIHGGDGFSQRRIFNGPPPLGPGPKFPPMRNKLPPPGYFNKNRRPPPLPPYGGGGFNQFNMRPPPPPGNGPMQQGYNPVKHLPSSQVVVQQTFAQNTPEQSIPHSVPVPTPPSTPPKSPSPPPTHPYQQQIQYSQQTQNHQMSHQTQPQQSTQFQPQFQPQFQQTPQQLSPTQYQQSPQQPSPSQYQLQQPATPEQSPPQLQSHQSSNTPQQWPQHQQNTTQIVGTIQPSQQTAQSNQVMTVVKPDTTNPTNSAQPNQIYQFHLPPSSNNQPNSIIQIHLSSTTEPPKDSGGKDYFTGSTFRPQKYDSPQTYPNTEYLPYEKPKSTPAPALNFKDMNSEKAGVYERPVIYKDSREHQERHKYKSHYTKPNGEPPGHPIEFTTESYRSTEYDEEVHASQSRREYAPVKPDYEQALTPPSKNDYGLLPPVKSGYGLSPLAKYDYEYYKNFKEYANKYSQLDPLYHPDSDVKASTEEEHEPELTLPERYDNSFSANYKHDERPPYEENRYKPPRKRPQSRHKTPPQPEEILSALGLSTNPLDHVDIVKTTNDKFKKEPLYSLPDRQISDDTEEEGDSREMGYPGTSYNMGEKGGASRLHQVKQPAPPELLHPQIKGLSPPSLASHVPDHREDIVTADRGSNEFWQHPPKIAHREDTPQHYEPGPKHTQSSGPPSHYSYGHPNEYGPPPGAHPPGYHPGPTGQPYPVYVTEPDPIIEIIVQDSNVTLPPLPRPKTTTPPPPTPEPVHVFYVRYSNNNQTHIGSPSEQSQVKLEPPVPALAVKGPDGQYRPPPTYHQQSIVSQYQPPQGQSPQPQPAYSPPGSGSHYNGQQRHQQVHAPHFAPTAPHHHYSQQPQTSASHFNPVHLPAPDSQPTSSTTMRAVIRLDKNEYDSPHLKVAFNPNSNPFSHLHQPQQQAEASQQYTQVVQPQQAPQHDQQFQNQQLLHQLQQQFQHLQQNQFHQANPQQQFPTATHQQQPTQPQFSTQLTQQFPHQQQIQQASSNSFQFQHPNQPQDFHQPQGSQPVAQFQPHPAQGQLQETGYSGHQHTAPSHQVAQFQVPPQPPQPDVSQQFQSQMDQAPSPSEQDFNLDPIWTNWNQPQQHQNPPPAQQPQHDQSPAASSNAEQMIPPAMPQTGSGGYNPLINYGGGEPLGLNGYHAIGSENSMRYDNPAGLRPPPGPVYPKLGSFRKRIGLDDLATLLGEESAQQQQTAHQQPIQAPEPEISATYHDSNQEHVQQQVLQATQQLHQNQQHNQKSQHQQYSEQDKMSKLPDDVPEELKKQLLESGILGNADVQVINYDQNLFKDLTNLPSAAIESFQQSDDISKLMAAATAEGTRPVRSILVINEDRRSLRPKRKEGANKLLLLIEDEKTLIYNVKQHSLTRVENKVIQNAIDYTHHKN